MEGTGSRPSRRVKRRWIAAATVVVLGVGGWFALPTLINAGVNHELGSLHKFGPAPTPTSSASAAPSASALPFPGPAVQGFMIFSTGSAGLSPADAAQYGIPDLASRGADGLTDVLMVAVVDTRTGTARVLSIPRDTWISSYGTKINAIYDQHGVDALASTVTALTGISISHEIAIDFAGFAQLTDAVGGVDLNVTVPTRDLTSGLNVPAAGCTHFNGREALALVRSRHTEVKNASGVWQTDSSASDFGRIVRQQAFLHAVIDKIVSPRLPLLVPKLLSAAQSNLTIDSSLDSTAVLALARAFSSSDPGALTFSAMPATDGMVGAADVLYPLQPEADQIFSEVRTGVVPTPSASPSASAAANPSGSVSPTASPSPSTGGLALPDQYGALKQYSTCSGGVALTDGPTP